MAVEFPEGWWSSIQELYKTNHNRPGTNQKVREDLRIPVLRICHFTSPCGTFLSVFPAFSKHQGESTGFPIPVQRMYLLQCHAVLMCHQT